MYVRIIAAAVLAIVVSSCGSASAPDNAIDSTALVYPPGVLAFKNVASATKAGLYPSTSMRTCCFLKKRAVIVLDKPAGSRTALFRFFVPKQLKDGNSIAVFVGGVTGTGYGAAGKWVEVSIAFPARFIGRSNVPVRIIAKSTFNPAQVGLNGDTRDLSVILQKVEFH